MRSHLTRYVFRHLLASEPIPHGGCLYRAGYRSTLPSRTASRSLCLGQPHVQRRTVVGFTNLFRGGGSRSRGPGEADMAPGVEQLFEFTKLYYSKARLPPEPVMAKAFNSFFSEKWRLMQPVEDGQIGQLDLVLDYLTGKSNDEGDALLSMANLRTALGVLTIKPKGSYEYSAGLAKAVYNEMLKRKDSEDVSDEAFARDLTQVVTVLVGSGKVIEARDAICCPAGYSTWKTWHRVLQGFAEAKDEAEVQETLRLMRSNGIPIRREMCEVLVRSYANISELEKAKEWYAQALELGADKILRDTFLALFRCCLQRGDLTWGQASINTLIEKFPKRPSVWPAIFLWALGTGKGADEINRMMTIMTREADTPPNINILNILIEFVMSRNDSYTAERLIRVGEQHGIMPNAKTYAMQIEYRLSVDDIDGARVAYSQLLKEEVGEDEDVSPVNKLIQAMCKSRRYDYDTIMSIVETFDERKARFEPETIAALSLIHLQREEYREVIGLLNAHVYHFSRDQRRVVSDVFASFCLDRNNTIAEVWDAYQILVSIFEEVPRETRSPIMTEFFTRRRPDLAARVFTHMRQHAAPYVRADADTYVDALVGIAATADRATLDAIDDQLKLDPEIQPSTRLSNAVMLAYSHCGRPGTALRVWQDVINSVEGPSYASVQIVFRACEKHPLGSPEAREIWTMLRRMDVAISRDLFAAYVGALAGSWEFDEVVELLGSAEPEFGFVPDVLMLGTFFNATRGMSKQEQVETWIKEQHPDVWSEMETTGIRKNVYDNQRTVRIDRTLHP